MRCSKSRIVAVVSGALLSVAAAMAAFADDTEIFVNQNAADIPANVLFIMDTSGSMNELVTTSKPYDPAQTYTADKCGTPFDPNSYYYSSKGLPKCGSTNKIAQSLFKCKSMLTPLSTTGFATDTFAQWGSAATNKTTGAGTVGNPTVVVNTTTYGWQKTVTSANTTGYVECKADAGVDGDGVDVNKLYASTDTFSIQTTTRTPPGSVVINSDSVTGFPERLTGVWDPTKNFFKNFGAAGGTATTCVGACTIYTLNYLNYLYDSSQTDTHSKMSIMHDAMAALLSSMTGVNVGLARYDWRGSGGMIMAPISPIDVGTTRTDDINLVKSWAPDGVTPLSETYFEAFQYFSGGSVLYGRNSFTANCTNWNAVDGTCRADTAFSSPSAAASRVGGSLASTKYDSPADYSCRQNFIVYLTDGLPNEAGQSNAAIAALKGKRQCDPAPPPGGRGGQCLAALADYMYSNDLRPDISKVQNVTSYFIGFGADFSSGGAPTSAFSYLQAAASAGGGQAYTATDLTELTSAFNDILASVIKTNTTFAAPAVTVNAFNRTQTLDNLYVSVFSPSATFHWPGNIKKYKFLNGQVVDSQGNPAVSPATGFFTDTSQSFWSATVDGSDVSSGGAASKLPDAAVRNVLTYTGTTYPSGLTALTGRQRHGRRSEPRCRGPGARRAGAMGAGPRHAGRRAARGHHGFAPPDGRSGAHAAGDHCLRQEGRRHRRHGGVCPDQRRLLSCHRRQHHNDRHRHGHQRPGAVGLHSERDAPAPQGSVRRPAGRQQALRTGRFGRRAQVRHQRRRHHQRERSRDPVLRHRPQRRHLGLLCAGRHRP